VDGGEGGERFFSRALEKSNVKRDGGSVTLTFSLRFVRVLNHND
jgi:hypothetical protein